MCGLKAHVKKHELRGEILIDGSSWVDREGHEVKFEQEARHTCPVVNCQKSFLRKQDLKYVFIFFNASLQTTCGKARFDKATLVQRM
jgi:hypothetical protein